MDELFQNYNDYDLVNKSLSTSSDSVSHIYSANEIALLLASLGAAIASVIYSFKHVKSSSCCGAKCNQVVEGVIVQDVMPQQPPQPPPRLESQV